MKSLSIIIPVLNDHKEVNATIASIRATAGWQPEIIVIDDCSSPPVILEDKDAILIRNPQRVGAGGSRHIGALQAKGEYLLLLDSHMRFEPGWYEKAIARIAGRDNVVHCGSCMGLDAMDMEIEEYQRDVPYMSLAVGRQFLFEGKLCRKKDDAEYATKVDGRAQIFTIPRQDVYVTLPATCRYFGAQLNIVGPNPNNPKEFQILEGVWQHDRTGEDDYEISCLMGACYFFPTKWFFHIGGLLANKHWGSEEPYLSLKTYLAGGSIRLMKGVRIGHKFHSGTVPYKLYDYWKHYNKMRTIMTCMNECEAKSLLPHFSNHQDIRSTMMQLNADRKEIMEEGEYNSKIFVHDLEWYCKRFNIKHPLQ